MSRIKAPSARAVDRYQAAMSRIRERFDIIDRYTGGSITISDAETIGTHLRKIIEGIAFGCVIATENSTKKIPRQAAGHWNAENIFVALKKLGEFPYPDPNRLRRPTPDELAQYPQISTVLEGVTENRLDVDQLRSIYRHTHPWTHEDNPYVVRPVNEKSASQLVNDVDRVQRLLWTHRIGIQGQSFICTLHDEQDGQVKVASAEKVQGL